MRKLLLLPFLFTVLFTACEQQEVLSIESENEILQEDVDQVNFQLETFTIDDIPNVASKVMKSTRGSGAILKSTANGQNSDGLTIDDTRVLAVTDSVGNISYSFRAHVPDTPYNVFYNVLVKKTADGNLNEPFMLRYEVDEDYWETYATSDRENATFQGNIKVYALNGINLPALSRSSNRSEAIPCDGITVSDGTGSSSRGSNGSSGGGGDGSCSGCGGAPPRSSNAGSNYSLAGVRPTGSGGRRTDVEIGIGLYTYEHQVDDQKSRFTGNKKQSISTSRAGSNGDCPEDEMMVPINEEEQIRVNLKDKTLCVYNKLQRNLTTNGIIQKTYVAFNDNLNYNSFFLTYNEKELSGTKNGETNLLYHNNYEITLNSKYIDNRAPIEIARTILHESVHALLLKHGFGDGAESFFDIFKDYVKETKDAADVHHAIMRDQYVIPIAKGLQLFDDSSEDFSYYENLAWSGLHQELTQEQLKDLSDATNKAREKGLDCE